MFSYYIERDFNKYKQDKIIILPQLNLINKMEQNQNNNLQGQQQQPNIQQSEKQQNQQQQQQQQQQSQWVEQKIHQCPHYQRNCHVEAPCCKIFYPCKLCHDDKYQYKKGCQVERMAFDKVEKIKCLECQMIQTPGQVCQNQKCNIKFGEYACLKCKLYQNNPDKVDDIFHCDDCGMCRRGQKQKYFHCHKCGYCRHISEQGKHKCNQNVAESKCPICLDVLKYSTKYYQSLKCGHLIHLQCLQSLPDINCPVCGMAMQKMSEQQNKHIQQMIEQTKDKLPQQVKNHKVNIMCNECLHKTMNAQFHYYGIKCEACGTYNTKMI